MKLNRLILSILLLSAILLTGCGKNDTPDLSDGTTATPPAGEQLGDESQGFGEAIADLGAYNGYFDGESTDVEVTCLSGTETCFKLVGNTLIFSGITADTVCTVSGKLRGSIVIDIEDDYRFDLELHGLSLVGEGTAPITVMGGDKVTVTAKKGYENYIYDTRDAIGEESTAQKAGAIHSEVDLEIAGKGALTVVSEKNNGIHSKKDLKVKNLTLLVACSDNALKGNDSVELTSCATTLIATDGDGIKTSNSDISSKGNQRGTVLIVGGSHKIYAACDGIDAAYNVEIDDSSTSLEIYTDKYSNYSNEVTAVQEDVRYIRFTEKVYTYSVKYYNSDEEFEWVNAEYHSEAKGGRSTYYYYSFPKKSNYQKLQLFVYGSGSAQGQDSDYLAASELITVSDSYDTLALSSRAGKLSFGWTNYTTAVNEGGFGGGPGGMGGPGGPGGMGGMGGPGGMNDGNTDKGDHSTKGIKAANEVLIYTGTVTVKSYDDAIHVNNDTALENGKTPLGNLTVKGGTLTLYSNDDGLHADGTIAISGGTVAVIHSYEGIEAEKIAITGGNVSVIAQDDGMNGTASTGISVSISGGSLYIYCNGDGIDANSRASYQGIVFEGGNTVVISNSGGNSAIDTEQGYYYGGGNVIALMPRGGMTSESMHCQNFGSIGAYQSATLAKDQFLTVSIGSATATLKMPSSMTGTVIILGNNAPTIDAKDSSSATLDSNGVAWN